MVQVAGSLERNTSKCEVSPFTQLPSNICDLQLFKLVVVSEVSITHVHSYFGLTMFPSTQNQVRQTGRVNTVEKSQTNATNVTLPQHEPSEHPSIHPLRIHPSIGWSLSTAHARQNCKLHLVCCRCSGAAWLMPQAVKPRGKAKNLLKNRKGPFHEILPCASAAQGSL